MSITSQLSGDSQELRIKVEGRFDFNFLQVFTDAYEKVVPQPKFYVIDLENCNYLDSSALRVVLTLREYAGGDLANIRIINANLDVKKIFAITKLNELFKVE